MRCAAEEGLFNSCARPADIVPSASSFSCCRAEPSASARQAENLTRNRRADPQQLPKRFLWENDQPAIALGATREHVRRAEQQSGLRRKTHRVCCERRRSPGRRCCEDASPSSEKSHPKPLGRAAAASKTLPPEKRLADSRVRRDWTACKACQVTEGPRQKRHLLCWERRRYLGRRVLSTRSFLPRGEQKNSSLAPLP